MAPWLNSTTCNEFPAFHAPMQQVICGRCHVVPRGLQKAASCRPNYSPFVHRKCSSKNLNGGSKAKHGSRIFPGLEESLLPALCPAFGGGELKKRCQVWIIPPLWPPSGCGKLLDSREKWVKTLRIAVRKVRSHRVAAFRGGHGMWISRGISAEVEL